MELINSLDDVKMMPNRVLVEYFNKNEEAHFGDVSLKILPYNFGSSELTGTGRGRHLERMGKVLKVCNRLKTRQNFSGQQKPYRYWNWLTDIQIQEGQWVWFSSSVFDNAPKLKYRERNLMIVDYHQLYMSEEKMLNGYVLGEKVKKPNPSKILHAPKEEHYDNIYRVYRKADSIEYLIEYVDILDFIEEGDYITTRFEFPYPLLEEPGHRFFSDRELHVFQSKEIMSKTEIHEQQA
jgi:hypothetical protein